MADGIRVNALAPGARTRARMIWRSPQGIYSDAVHKTISGSPDVVAPAIVYLLSDLSATITGQLFAMLGGRFGLFAHPRRLRALRRARDVDRGRDRRRRRGRAPLPSSAGRIRGARVSMGGRLLLAGGGRLSPGAGSAQLPAARCGLSAADVAEYRRRFALAREIMEHNGLRALVIGSWAPPTGAELVDLGRLARQVRVPLRATTATSPGFTSGGPRASRRSRWSSVCLVTASRR